MFILSIPKFEKEKLENIPKFIDSIELRYDLINEEIDWNFLLNKFNSIISTLKGSDDRIFEIYTKSIKNGSNLFDFDYKTPENLVFEFIKVIRNYEIQNINKQANIIVSLHENISSFNDEEFSQFMDISNRFQADYRKIVLSDINTPEDWELFLEYYKRSDSSVSLFGSGFYGKKSREYAIINNSLLNYIAYDVNSRTGKDQLTIDDVKKIAGCHHE